MNQQLKSSINKFLDLFLILLAFLLLLTMARDIYHIFRLVIEPLDNRVIDEIIQEVLTFFMIFEFIMLIFRYVQEGHHIPIRYLIYICITAVLRQILSVHGSALEVLLLALAILVLVFTLILVHNAMIRIRGKNHKDKIEIHHLFGEDDDMHG
ncbi:MAG: phosphate-starvation-inducible PsiE family protein [Lactobacillales bacterium]|jgi:protein PsiE|nr:phosphate-starvation-inducible PsiE family protein [Lactobacillales bacterium]